MDPTPPLKLAQQMYEAFVPKPVTKTQTRYTTVLRGDIRRKHRTPENGYNNPVPMPDCIISLLQHAIDLGRSVTDGLVWYVKMQEIYPDWGPDSTLPLFEDDPKRGPLPIEPMPVQWGDEFVIEFADENPNSEDTDYFVYNHLFRYNEGEFYRHMTTGWVKVD